MKIAVLFLSLIPSTALAGVVSRAAIAPGASFAPLQLSAPVMPGAASLLPMSAPALTLTPSLAAPSIAPALAAAIAPAAAVPAAAKPAVAAALPAAARAEAVPAALAALLPAASAPEGGAPRVPAQFWADGAARFDGASFGSYRNLDWAERQKVDATERYASNGSQVFQSLNDEFRRQGGYYLLDSNPHAKYMAAAAVDRQNRPVILLTHDLLNRFNGRHEEMYRGAPWEFIASVIAREQVFFNAWYGTIPASAEKLAASFMNMTRVFVDLTNGTSRSWATDKDYQAVSGDRSTYTQWNWFEQLVAASRAAAQGVGTNSGHLLDSKFFSWVRDWTAPQDKPAIPSFQYSLWEQYDGRYYRPGDAKNGQPLPPGAPRIDKATYDAAANTAYGTDGKGSDQHGALNQQTMYGWIIKWLKDRFEV
ncbi:MAG: hypothetical protein M0D55_07595 [Elusimicrobiota bacterium]|nr:MAG: hypothetical protein M0D55_07595 [Elusimicrobiota bacterium]